MKKIIVGLTGASGSLLFKRTIEILASEDVLLYIVVTPNGKSVFEFEVGINLDDFLKKFDNLIIQDIDNMFSSIASGSSLIDGMIIIPCSMGTIGNIANCTSNNLLVRAADVTIKEQRPLVLGIRETPLSKLHLDNLQKLAITNVFLNPLVISLYNKPDSIEKLIDNIVYRNLTYLGFNLNEKIQWNHDKE